MMNSRRLQWKWAMGQAMLVVLVLAPSACAEDKRNPTVGLAGRIEGLVLPGTELQGRPLDDDSIPVIVRIEKVENVLGDPESLRYDIVFYGMQPGPLDLSEFLVRKDGSSVENLPSIPVEIESLLPPGTQQPNELSNRWLPRLGGYRLLAIAAAVLWVLILIAMIFAGRRRRQDAVDQEKPLTLADYLKPRLDAANKGTLPTSQYAELEAMLTSFWRKRLNLESLPIADAIGTIRQDDQAGPLLGQIEQWMHNPQSDKSVELAELLEPYQEISLADVETEADGLNRESGAESVEAI